MATIIHTVKLVASAKEANDELLKFQDRLVGVERSVTSMERSLSGTAMLQRTNTLTLAVAKLGGATGDLATKEQILVGVSKLTAAEQVKVNASVTQAIEKYRLLGQTAPSAMLALKDATAGATTQTSALAGLWTRFGPQLMTFLSVGAAVRGVSSIVRWADDLDELSQGIGVNVVALQKLQYAWSTTGSSMEAGIKAIQTMGEGISEGTAAKAIARLGLDFEAIRKMSPEDQFMAITAALKTVTNEADFAALGADIFKKTWKSVGISVMNDMAGVAAKAQALTEEQVKFLAVLQGRWEGLVLAAKVSAGRWLSGVSQEVGEIGTWVPQAEAETNQRFGVKVPGAPARESGGLAIPSLLESDTELLGVMTKLAKEAELLKGHYHALAAVTYALAEVMDDGTNSLRGYYEATTGLTEDGLIPAWETFTDLLVMLPEYEGSLDVTRNMTEDVTTATKGWRSELSSLAGSFRLLQQSAGEGGLGRFAQSMADMFGAIEMGEQASRKLSQGMRDLTDPKIDPSTSLMKIGGAAIAMAAAMDQATQSTSRTMNMLSGAATGASMGANPALMGATGGFSILAGAAVGAIYGYYKDTPGDDVRMAHKTALVKQLGTSWGVTSRQMQMAGISQADLNRLLGMGEDDLEAFTLGAEELTVALSEYSRTIDTLKTAASGTQTMADAMNDLANATGGTETQFQRLGVYAGAIFGKLLLQTGSVVEAMGAIGGTLDALIEAQSTRGFTTTPLMDQLLGLRRVMTENQDVMGRVTGLGQIGSALGTAGLRGMGILPTFGADLAETFGQLSNRQGVGANQALMLMQAPLQQLWEATSGMGSAQRTQMFSPETLRLLAQAEAAGVVGKDMQSLATQQLDVLTDIRDLLGGADAAVWARGGGAGGPFGKQTFDFDRENIYTRDGTMSGRRYADGTNGFEYFGAGTPAMLHGWEAVVPLSKAHAGATQAGDLHVHVEIDRREIGRAVVRDFPDAVRRYTRVVS